MAEQLFGLKCQNISEKWPLQLKAAHSDVSCLLVLSKQQDKPWRQEVAGGRLKMTIKMLCVDFCQ